VLVKVKSKEGLQVDYQVGKVLEKAKGNLEKTERRIKTESHQLW